MDHARTLEELRSAVIGRWVSLSVELRPTEDRTGSGVIAPTRLTRDFTYRDDDTFTGIITMLGDEYGDVTLMDFEFGGHLRWGGPHPIADGAFEVDYVLDARFAVTPRLPRTAEMLNQGLPEGMTPFADGATQDILGRAFPMFDIVEGRTVVDHDLLYLAEGLLFFGAKHVDGTPFDTPGRRPHQLQIPLRRAA